MSSNDLKSFHDFLLKKLSQNNIEKPQDVKFVRILNNSLAHKRISIEFLYDDNPGVLILEKSFFNNDSAVKFAEGLVDDNVLQPLTNLFRNDSYGAYNMKLKNPDSIIDWNHLFINIIHPARPKDIEKALDLECFFVEETPELYRKVTKPYIDSQVQSGNLQWLYNVLEKKAEVERIVYEKDITDQNGYLVVKDMKWKTTKPIEEMTELEKQEIHLNAIIIRRDIHTLRDLRQEHLPLLKSINIQARKAISEKLRIEPDKLRVYIHYQPSFYHLHFHFTHIKAEVGGIQTERAHLLPHIISNIELMPDYYEKMTLNFAISLASSLKKEQYQITGSE